MTPSAEVLETRIDTIALDGDGVARTAEGPLFVPGTAPGELVRVRVSRGGGHPRTARLLEVLEPSPDRVGPPCPVFGRCGGCQLQHLAPAAQLEAKRGALAHALGRAVGPIVPAPSAWAWRARVRLHAARGAVGLHAAGSHELVALDACPILDPVAEQALRTVAPAVARAVGGNGEIRIDRGRDGRPVLHVRVEASLPTEAYASLEGHVVSGAVGGIAIEVPGVQGLARLGDPDPWTVAADGEPMRLAPGSFAQANPAVTQQLFEALVTGLDPQPTDRLLELHAGSGTFTLALARHVAEVVAVESSAAAVQALEDNLRSRGIANVRALRADADEHARKARGRFDLVVLDPPRTGASEELCEAIVSRKPRRIGYVSCNPRALGRDLRRLESLGLVVQGITGFDMFPQSAHIETLAILQRPDK